jgi:hypothetical protein
MGARHPHRQQADPLLTQGRFIEAGGAGSRARPAEAIQGTAKRTNISMDIDDRPSKNLIDKNLE